MMTDLCDCLPAAASALQQAGQRQAAHGPAADLQERSAGNVVAKAGTGTENVEHGLISIRRLGGEFADR